MNSVDIKQKEPTSKAIANSTDTTQLNNSGFEDNRTEATMQRKLQNIVAGSAGDNGAVQLKKFDNRNSSTPIQKMDLDEEEGKMQFKKAPIQKVENNTGLPDRLKSGVENLSGVDISDVKVHYNSDKPAQLNAHAYAQGTDIHVASGQEKHLPHEAWHVVQQKQGRVKPTMQLREKVNINDDVGLEKEADVMGARASVFQAKYDQLNNDKPERGSTNAIQLKTLPNFSVGGSVNGNNEVWFSDGEATLSKYWQVDTITKNTRVELLKSIADVAAVIGNEANFKSNNLWNFAKAEKEKNAHIYFDPIRVRIKGEYGDNPKQVLNLDYHFGNNWHGYVIRVHDTGLNITKEMKDKSIQNIIDDGEAATNYSNIHENDANPGGPLSADNDADATTKIAGEGARWKAISGNAGKIRDTTKFYTNENSEGKLSPNVRYVTFPVLWKSWMASFNKDFGISNDRLITELKKANLLTSAGESAIGVTASSNMVNAQDVCADVQQPIQQSDLNLNTIKYLVYKKDESIVESDDSLAEETSDFEDLINAIAGVTVKNVGGYIGGGKFAYLCEVSNVANTAVIGAGYSEQAASHDTLTYPEYRSPVLASLAEKTAKGPDITGGVALYAQEKRAMFEYYVNEFIKEVGGSGAENVEDVNVEAFVRNHLIPWNDLDEPLPALCFDVGRFDEELDEYYQPLIAEYLEVVEEAREVEIKRRIGMLLALVPYFGAKSKADQNRIWGEKRAEVCLEMGIED